MNISCCFFCLVNFCIKPTSLQVSPHSLDTPSLPRPYPSILEIIQFFCASLGKVVKTFDAVILLCKVCVIQKQVKNKADKFKRRFGVMLTPFSKDSRKSINMKKCLVYKIIEAKFRLYKCFMIQPNSRTAGYTYFLVSLGFVSFLLFEHGQVFLRWISLQWAKKQNLVERAYLLVLQNS